MLWSPSVAALATWLLSQKRGSISKLIKTLFFYRRLESENLWRLFASPSMLRKIKHFSMQSKRFLNEANRIMGWHAAGGEKVESGRQYEKQFHSSNSANFTATTFTVCVLEPTTKAWVDSAENCKTFFRSTTNPSSSLHHPLFSHLDLPTRH